MGTSSPAATTVLALMSGAPTGAPQNAYVHRVKCTKFFSYLYEEYNKIFDTYDLVPRAPPLSLRLFFYRYNGLDKGQRE